MKKRWLGILALMLTAVSCGTLGACKNKDKKEAGKSAYEIWLDAGNTGTEDDFLAWLKGAQGDQGAEGKSAYQIWLDAGNTGTEEDFLSWLQGDPSSEYGESLRFQKISGKNEYRVMGIGSVTSLDIVIPASYRGLPVTEIGSMAFYVSPANKNTIVLAKYDSYAYNWAKDNKVKVDFYR